jgi:hypothetical protein
MRVAGGAGHAAGQPLVIFPFARMRGVPMLALNVDRGCTCGVREHRWTAVPLAAAGVWPGRPTVWLLG